jgi:RimJ/RimL family protein N-acetyltransferase
MDQRRSTDGQDVRRVPFDERYRDLSFGWLSDPEIARLTRVPPMTRESQAVWFAGLPARTDYAIWGIECDGVPIGAFGLKLIGVDEGAEYFMYIGDPAYWGRGIARWSFDEVYEQARARGLKYLYGIVGKDNPRSLAVDLRHGFEIRREDDTAFYIALPIAENA